MKFRKNVRLADYDYRTNGYYFVTMCTDYRSPYLENANIKSIVVAELARLNDLQGVKVDYYVLMPDHAHLIIILDESRYSLFEIARRLKSKTTVMVKKLFVKQIADQGRQLQKLWQPNYYEHIIRNEKALDKIRHYIQNNPEKEMYDWNELERL